jgi:hypothetical protein
MYVPHYSLISRQTVITKEVRSVLNRTLKNTKNFLILDFNIEMKRVNRTIDMTMKVTYLVLKMI